MGNREQENVYLNLNYETLWPCKASDFSENHERKNNWNAKCNEKWYKKFDERSLKVSTGNIVSK